ncbi:MAG: hypothetical protein WCZ10_10530 [Desulfobulbaceae bacterium]
MHRTCPETERETYFSGRPIPLPPTIFCPECGGPCEVQVEEWEADTGIPTLGGFRLLCRAEEVEFAAALQEERDPAWEHRHFQSDWQPAISAAFACLKEHVRIRQKGGELYAQSSKNR